MTGVKDEDIRAKIKASPPKPSTSNLEIEGLSLLGINTSYEESVRDDVKFLKEHPLINEGTTVTGWVYDTKTGKLTEAK